LGVLQETAPLLRVNKGVCPRGIGQPAGLFAQSVVLTGVVARDQRLNTYFEVTISGKKGFIPAGRLDRTDVYKIMRKVNI